MQKRGCSRLQRWADLVVSGTIARSVLRFDYPGKAIDAELTARMVNVISTQASFVNDDDIQKTL
jgi:ABC-type arginine transport system ATPase subunit